MQYDVNNISRPTLSVPTEQAFKTGKTAQTISKKGILDTKIKIYFDRAFKVKNALSYILDGLVIARHNEIRYELIYLSQRSFNLAPVCAEILIHQVHTISKQEIRQGSDKDK